MKKLKDEEPNELLEVLKKKRITKLLSKDKQQKKPCKTKSKLIMTESTGMKTKRRIPKKVNMMTSWREMKVNMEMKILMVQKLQGNLIREKIFQKLN